jgi:hypothetical protein
MFLAIAVLAIIVSMPIVGIIVVSVASKREDAVGTLGGPSRGAVQSAARRVLDFQSDVYWRAAGGAHVKVSRPVLTSAGQPLQDADDDAPILVPVSALAISSAA